jgi:hypothetical protein
MSRLAVFAPAVLVLGLAACASDGGTSRYSEELRQLNEDCAARGGILVPSGGPTTGRPQTDNICKISGGASRLPEGG